MTISESTLESWTTQGAVTNSSRTYQSVKNAVNNERYGLGDFEHEYKIHLQGSYANDTNVWGSNDVDVVVKLTKPFQEDLSGLTEDEVEEYWKVYSESDYTFQEFYEKVYRSLKNYFGRIHVEQGKKAIKIESNDDTGIPVDADVVACVQYRKYNSFSETNTDDYVEGMYFETQEIFSNEIINYSEKHRRNGEEKNDSTNGCYKPTIRMFKKARDHMESKDIIDDDVATSYFIEGLLFNVPCDRFKESNLQDRYDRIIEYLENSDVEDFVEQSKQYSLCVDDESERWNVSDAETTIQGYRELWEGW